MSLVVLDNIFDLLVLVSSFNMVLLLLLLILLFLSGSFSSE